MPDLDSLATDQQHALRKAAATLRGEFDGMFSAETIERFLESSYDQFAGRATVQHFLPLLAERFARQRLQALARVEHAPTTVCRPCCSSVCTTPADRRWRWAGSTISPATAPSPGRAAPSRASRSTRRRWRRWPRSVSTSPASSPSDGPTRSSEAADVVVTMGCGDACPLYPGKRYEDWELDDPAGLDVAAVRPVRDEIRRRVETLLTSLGVNAVA